MTILPFPKGEACIRTFTGRQVNLFAMQPEDVEIVDIAHALSNVCRWGGHSAQFYSVAQHSVLVADLVSETHRAFALAALLHDASEAYLGDMPTPLKRTTWAAQYRALEARITAVIAERFQLPLRLPPLIKRADQALLATEARDLMTGVELHGPPPLPIAVTPWLPQEAYEAFLDRYRVAAIAPPRREVQR